MDSTSLFTFTVMLITVFGSRYVHGGRCFEFFGNAFLIFDNEENELFRNDGAMHYSLKFRRAGPNGILLYSRASQSSTGHDWEAFYMRDGKLVYDLFNTSPTGVEGYFGAHVESNISVANTESWVEVELFRAYSHTPTSAHDRRNLMKTGFVVTVDSTVHSFLQYDTWEDIQLSSEIHLGGFLTKLSDTIGNFSGMIKDVYEAKNDFHFQNPSINFRRLVSLTCPTDFIPV